jgi:transcriptional regulator GlxA family with amidase domain
VTAGIDLALEIVRHHYGTAISAEVARHLVVYRQGAGCQQQDSTSLVPAAVHPRGTNQRRRHVERGRVDAARRMLDRTDDGLGRITRRWG